MQVRSRTLACAMLPTLLMFSGVAAQSPRALMDVSSGRAQRAVSSHNFWIGSQLGYKFGGSGDFADNLLFNGNVVLQQVDWPKIPAGVSIPIMGNLSKLVSSADPGKIESATQDLLLSTQGLALGIYPTYTTGGDQSQVRTTFYGSAGWKLNAFKDSATSTTSYLHQGRFSVGIEFAARPNQKATAPFTLSLNPTLTIFDSNTYETVFGAPKSSMFAMEFTGIVPISDGFGLIAEAITVHGVKPAWRFGILIAPSESQ